MEGLKEQETLSITTWMKHWTMQSSIQQAKVAFQIINDLRDAGFTGRNGKTKQGKGSDMCEVYRMECGVSTCKKVARLLHMSARDAENQDVPEFSIEYSSSDCNFRDIG